VSFEVVASVEAVRPHYFLFCK